MTFDPVRLYPVELRVPAKVLEGLDRLAHRAGVTRAQMAQRLFDAAYAARFADVGDPALQLSVSRLAPSVSSAPVAPPAVLATPPAPGTREAPPDSSAPAAAPEEVLAPPAHPSTGGFPDGDRMGLVVAAAGDPPPALAPAQGGASITPAQQRSIKALYAMGAKPFDIAQQLKVPLADVRAFLTSSRRK